MGLQTSREMSCRERCVRLAEVGLRAGGRGGGGGKSVPSREQLQRVTECVCGPGRGANTQISDPGRRLVKSAGLLLSSSPLPLSSPLLLPLFSAACAARGLLCKGVRVRRVKKEPWAGAGADPEGFGSPAGLWSGPPASRRKAWSEATRV